MAKLEVLEPSAKRAKPSVGIAIIGCGQIMTHHISAMAASSVGFEVRCLVDPSEERRKVIRELASTKGIASDSLTEVKSLEDLLADATVSPTCPNVLIAVPHDLHQSVALAALKGGKTVILEKPLAPTLEACKVLHRASAAELARGGPMLILAEQSPYWQEVVKARELIASGAIGQIVSASAYYYESMRDNMTSGGLDSDGGLGWRGINARAGGGIVIDGGLHWLRPLREMVGDIEAVVGVVRPNLAPELKMEGEALAHALLRICKSTAPPLAQPEGSGPLIATYSANMLAKAPMAHDACPYFRVTGTLGELVVAGDGLNPDGGGGLRIYTEEFAKGKDLFSKDRQGGFFLGFRDLWVEIARILTERDHRAAHKTVRDAGADVGVVMSLYESSKSKQWETCDLFADEA